MDLKGILAVGGKPGLFKMIAQTKNGFIAESLTEKKRFPFYANDRVSTLEEISVFTTNEDASLKDILKKIYEKENGGRAIDHKADPGALKKYFEEILPDYDQERVYVSDIRKIVGWYNILHANNILDFSEEEKDSSEESTGDTEEKKE